MRTDQTDKRVCMRCFCLSWPVGLSCNQPACGHSDEAVVHMRYTTRACAEIGVGDEYDQRSYLYDEHSAQTLDVRATSS